LTAPLLHSKAHQKNPGQEPRKTLETLRILAVVAFPVILAVALQRISVEQPLKAGDTAPDILLQSLNSESISLPKLYSQRLAVLFFSAECSHCKQEIKNMERLRETFNGSVQLLLITTSNRAKTKLLMASLGIRVPVAIDEQGKAQSAFGVFTVPALFLIDTRGTIHAGSFGERSLDVRREQLESFLHATADRIRTPANSPR
jgi:peroxiredoxin